jgi:hypothetical protein
MDSSTKKILLLAAVGATGYYLYSQQQSAWVGPALPPTLVDIERKQLPKPTFNIPPLPGQRFDNGLKAPLDLPAPIRPPPAPPVIRKGQFEITPFFPVFQ